MDAYILDGDIYCAACAPQGADGPHANGGGEADCPNHCGSCGKFLENPLTSDGITYVRVRLMAGKNNPVRALWAHFYADVLALGHSPFTGND